MKLIAPDYYPEFKCIAGKCTHSCCVGWEIDIDEEKLQEYQNCPGEIGRKLRENIELTPEDSEAPAHFRLTEDERCPFLNKDNLCELILTLGEDSLCQICTDHPRFRNYWSSFTEIGLGMACEEAARIILSKESKTELIVLEDDGDDEADALWDAVDDMLSDDELNYAAGADEQCDDFEDADMEMEYLQLRDELMDILQDRSIQVDERIRRMLEHCSLDVSELEFKEGPLNETACEQFAVYLLYRNFADVIYDGRLENRVRFVAESYMRVRNEWAACGSTDVAALIEPARRFSDEVEYDTDTWA